MSSGVMFARALYWSDLVQVFCSKSILSLRIDSSVFRLLKSMALVISSPFLLEVCRKLITFGGLVSKDFSFCFFVWLLQ